MVKIDKLWYEFTHLQGKIAFEFGRELTYLRSFKGDKEKIKECEGKIEATKTRMKEVAKELKELEK